MHSRPVIMRTSYLDGCQVRGTTAELPSEPYLSALMQSSSWLKTCLGGLTYCVALAGIVVVTVLLPLPSNSVGVLY